MVELLNFSTVAMVVDRPFWGLATAPGRHSEPVGKRTDHLVGVYIYIGTIMY